MGEAQRAGYFTNVNLLPVEEYYSDLMDHAIADTAVGQLRIDLNNGLDHLIMARTSNKQRAEQIFTIYQNIVPNFNPIVVHSDYPKTEIKTS
ncbi:hypothetical protein [Klebsiella pneumoniae]|uniref:hypothetical protein n=1 Tax=Klebsiella pneumoniae TaxID=573 RepID=UPI001E542C70|nr:hypothetical protein [Klebsiella pneumoniae]